MVWFSTIAAAATLDFETFELTGWQDGIKLAYQVAAPAWPEIATRRARGEATVVTVTLEAEDSSYTAVVPLNAATRTVQLTLRPWPPGTMGAVSIRNGPYEGVAIGGEVGGRLQVEGGLIGAAPENPPLATNLPEPDPAPVPAPRVVVPVAPPAPAPVPVPAPAKPDALRVSQLPPAPIQDVVARCQQVFGHASDQGACIGALVNRPQAARELEACASLTSPRHRRGCLQIVSQRPQPWAGPVEACVAGLGPSGDAMNCVQTANRNPEDASEAIVACTTHIQDVGHAIGCVKRSARIDVPIGGMLAACSLGFATEELDCLARAARSPFDRSGLITACTTHYHGDERVRCLGLLSPSNGPHPEGVVDACASMYQRDDRFECMARARSQPQDERVRECGKLRSKRDQFDCIGPG